MCRLHPLPHLFLQIQQNTPETVTSNVEILRNQFLYDSWSVVFWLYSAMAQIPRVSGFIYNTAGWKEDTADLVYQALEVGFRNFETGNHPGNYREDLVGKGIRKAISKNIIDQSEIFVSLLCLFSSFQQSPIQLSSDPNQVQPPDIAQHFRHRIPSWWFDR